MNKIKDKNEKGKKPDSIKKISSTINTNRTSFYKKYVRKKKSNIFLIKRLWFPGLIENMCQLIYLLNGSIGRDKLYKTLYNNGFKVSLYIFRFIMKQCDTNHLPMQKGINPPKEKKSKSVWNNDYVDGNFKSEYPWEVVCVDIKYIKFQNKWWYLRVITEDM